jgi:hypothetical protein
MMQIEQSKKALVFYGYYIRAALVRVRPATPDEVLENERFTPGFQKGLYVELDRQSLQFEVADRFFMKWRLPETQRSEKQTLEPESALFFLTDEQWETLIQAEKEFHATNQWDVSETPHENR